MKTLKNYIFISVVTLLAFLFNPMIAQAVEVELPEDADNFYISFKAHYPNQIQSGFTIFAPEGPVVARLLKNGEEISQNYITNIWQQENGEDNVFFPVPCQKYDELGNENKYEILITSSNMRGFVYEVGEFNWVGGSGDGYAYYESNIDFKANPPLTSYTISVVNANDYQVIDTIEGVGRVGDKFLSSDLIEIFKNETNLLEGNYFSEYLEATLPGIPWFLDINSASNNFEVLVPLAATVNFDKYYDGVLVSRESKKYWLRNGDIVSEELGSNLTNDYKGYLLKSSPLNYNEIYKITFDSVDESEYKKLDDIVLTTNKLYYNFEVHYESCLRLNVSYDYFNEDGEYEQYTDNFEMKGQLYPLTSENINNDNILPLVKKVMGEELFNEKLNNAKVDSYEIGTYKGIDLIVRFTEEKEEETYLSNITLNLDGKHLTTFSITKDNPNFILTKDDLANFGADKYYIESVIFNDSNVSFDGDSLVVELQPGVENNIVINMVSEIVLFVNLYIDNQLHLKTSIFGNIGEKLDIDPASYLPEYKFIKMINAPSDELTYSDNGRVIEIYFEKAEEVTDEVSYVVKHQYNNIVDENLTLTLQGNVGQPIEPIQAIYQYGGQPSYISYGAIEVNYQDYISGKVNIEVSSNPFLNTFVIHYDCPTIQPVVKTKINTINLPENREGYVVPTTVDIGVPNLFDMTVKNGEEIKETSTIDGGQGYVDVQEKLAINYLASQFMFNKDNNVIDYSLDFEISNKNVDWVDNRVPGFEAWNVDLVKNDVVQNEDGNYYVNYDLIYNIDVQTQLIIVPVLRNEDKSSDMFWNEDKSSLRYIFVKDDLYIGDSEIQVRKDVNQYINQVLAENPELYCLNEYPYMRGKDAEGNIIDCYSYLLQAFQEEDEYNEFEELQYNNVVFLDFAPKFNVDVDVYLNNDYILTTSFENMDKKLKLSRDVILDNIQNSDKIDDLKKAKLLEIIDKTTFEYNGQAEAYFELKQDSIDWTPINPAQPVVPDEDEEETLPMEPIKPAEPIEPNKPNESKPVIEDSEKAEDVVETPVKTEDNTNIDIYVISMILALITIVCVQKRKDKKNK